MKIKRLILFTSIILLSVLFNKNLFILSEFKYIQNESFSYNYGTITGIILKIIGLLGLIKFISNKFNNKTDLKKI